jgi:hypothetical protein
MATGGLLLFLLSLGAMLLVCHMVAARLAASAWDRAWIALGVATMLLGAASILASMVDSYTPAGFLAAQAVVSLSALAASAAARRWPTAALGPEATDDAAAQSPLPLGAAEWATVLAIMLVLTFSAVERFITPLHFVDELMYHASRAGYWVQHQSVFPYESHNDRQTTFPFGAELIFAWPLLLTGWDLPGRVLHWLAVPLATAGVFSITRLAGASRAAALLAALLYTATPTVLTRAFQLKSDVWTPVFIIGAAWFVTRAARNPQGKLPALFWAGAMTALAMNIKVTVATMILALLVLPFLLLPLRQAIRGVVAIGLGGLVATLLSGLAVMLIANTANHGHPLGPQYMRKIVQPDFSLSQTWTHVVRVPAYLIELPENPSDGLRRWIKDTTDDALDWLGAGELLPMEDEPNWPGISRDSRYATRFSLGGMLWIPLLAVGVGILARDLLRARRPAPPAEAPPRSSLSPVGALVLIQLPLFAGVVFLVRWMGGGPERFWLAPYALSLAISLALLDRWRFPAGRRILAGLAIIAGCLVTYPSSVQLITRIDQRLAGRLRPTFRLAPAIAQIPPGSTVLLVGSWNAQDYPLMAPEGRLVNRVITWGQRPFEPERMEEILEAERIDYVVIENGRQVWHGRPPVLHTEAMTQWLASQSHLTSIQPPGAGDIRVFHVERSPTIERSSRGSFESGDSR